MFGMVFFSYLQWIERSGNESLLNLAPKSLNRRFFMCDEHFDDAQYLIPTKRQRLRRNAVPKINCERVLSSEAVAMYKAKFFSLQVPDCFLIGYFIDYQSRSVKNKTTW